VATKALVLIADGTEEIEAVVAIDVMRRAQWDVAVAGLKDGPIVASRGVKIVPDTTIDRVDAGSFDVLVVPGGGKGVENLSRDDRVLRAVQSSYSAGRLVAAVCAGPLVLQAAGILEGRRITTHPGVAQQVRGAKRVDERVVRDGNIITSQGAGTSVEFALAIVAEVDGQAKADEVARGMVV
jgi:protein deglycase